MWQRKTMITGMAMALALVASPEPRGMAEAEIMELDSISRLYGPVFFDHGMHVDLESNCATCHHHTIGEGELNANCARCHQETQGAHSVNCRDCHAAEPFSAAYLEEKEKDYLRYHQDKPGLNAAYHLSCIGCHQELGAPVGCLDCHARTPEGEEFYRSGQYAPVPGGKKK
jgi:hypothetical protein